MKLRASGNLDAAAVVKDITQTPQRASKYRKAYRKSIDDKPWQQLSPLEALSMMVEAGLSRSQYEVVRSSCKKLYPCYSIVQKERKECYPPDESFRISETIAEVDLQSLMDHTVRRLLLSLKEVMGVLKEEEKKSLELICKWGCDGTTQVQYKMKFENPEDSDKHIFQSSMVPVQLVCGSKKKKTVVWKNPTPSSPRYCRPMRITFIRETKDVINQEIDYWKEKINNLQTTNFEGTSTKHTLLLTMVDGKVCNAATQTTSTMKCFICGQSSSKFNDLTKKLPSTKTSLEFGLSILHAWIRIFESLLHVAYKLPVKKWRLNADEKKQKDAEKAKIQEKFKKEMGLLVDVPKAGFGNTNDGNTSRRFFAEHEKSAKILGLDVNLIFRFKIILETISSGFQIDVSKFEKYAEDTAELYVNLYGWHPMTPTMHKVLRHGAEIISNALLPIGQLSEEAAEARNKHIREFRLHHARKFSREQCNRDVLNRLLLTSDPLLSGMRKAPKKHSGAFHKEALELMLPVEPDSDEEEEEDNF